MSSTSPIREKVFTSADEIKQAIEQLGKRLVQVHELRKEGLQFRDALRVTAEFQIRETIREVFGDQSPEFAEHQQLRIRSNSQEHVEETIYVLQSLILLLERKKADMLGIPPPPDDPPLPRKPRVIEHRAVPSPQPAPVRPTEMAASASVAGQDGQTLSADEAAVIHKIRETQAVVQRLVGTPSSAAPAAPPPASNPGPTSRTTVPPAVPPVDPPLRPTVAAAPAPAAPPSAAPRTVPSDPSSRQAEQPGAPAPRPVAAPPQAGPVVVPPAATAQAASVAPPAPTIVRPVDRIRRICSRFHQVTRQLRKRGEDRATLEVEDQRDVQDLLEILLSVEFDEIRAIEWAPPYLDGARRTDLVVPQEGIVISVRRTRPGAGSKIIAEQIAADARHYMQEPSCNTLFCFVYDPEGRIGNPQTLEREQTQHVKGTQVEVLIEPK
jgi:hypothetical protein